MKYRKFGRLDWRASALGFGAMRLPVIDGDPARIDEAEAILMMRYAIDQGVNYVDTAYGYHRGNSEVLVGKALEDGYREKVKLATKMPTWMVNSRSDMDRFLNEQLNRLKTDRVDLYLLHGLNRERWPKMRDLEVLEWAEGAMADGRIGRLGFSFHDGYELFKDIVDGYDGWVLSQIQYNYMDAEYQAGTRGPKVRGLQRPRRRSDGAHRRRQARPPSSPGDPGHLGRGGGQEDAGRVGPPVGLEPARARASGMSTMDQVAENVESASRSGPGTLSDAELKLIARVREKYQEYGFVGCTGCGYCMPCPEGVDIPRIFDLYNEYYRRDRDGAIVRRHGETVAPGERAGRCARCGECEALCPQQLPIRGLLAKATRIFERKG